MLEMYLAIFELVLSSVIFIDTIKEPIYFLSKKLVGVEPRYSKIKKIAPALVHYARRFKPYFQGRITKVYTRNPLRETFQNSQKSICMVEWENYLGKYNIEFDRRKAEKGHTLALLLIDFPIDDLEC